MAAASHVPRASCRSWAAYVAGTLLVLMHECGGRPPPGMGFSALVASDVPPGEVTCSERHQGVKLRTDRTV